MMSPERFAFVELHVPDVAAATDFYERCCGFQVLRRADDVAVLGSRCGRPELLVRADADRRGVGAVGYAAASAAELDVYEWRLEAARAGGEPGRDLARDVVPELAASSLAFTDDDGYRIVLVADVVEFPSLDPETVTNAPDELIHPLLGVADLPRALSTYQGMLGFAVSDFVATKTAFLRCRDGFHHSLAIAEMDDPHLDHVCFHVVDFDELMRVRARLIEVGGVECTPLYHHGGSYSRSYYFDDPHSGEQFEFCQDHRRIDDPDHTPKVLPASPTTFDLWKDY